MTSEQIAQELSLAALHCRNLDVPWPENPVASWIDREPWLRERTLGVGSSEVWKLFSDDPDDLRSLYFDKIEPDEADPEPTPDQKRGIRGEPQAIEDYQTETDRRVIRLPLLRYAEEPLVLDDADGLILPGPEDDPEHKGFPGYGAAEVKTPRYHGIRTYRDKGIPERIIFQCQHHMLTLGVRWCEVIVYDIMGQQLLHWTVEANEDLQKEMVERVRDFWHAYVTPRRVPESAPPVSGVAVDAVEGEARIRTDEEWLEVATLYRELKPEHDRLKEDLDDVKRRLREAAGEDYGTHFGGGVRGTLSRIDGRTSWKKTCEKVVDAFPLNGRKLAEMVENGELRDEDGEILSADETQDLICHLTLDVDAMTVVGKPSDRFTPTIVEED